MEEIFKRLLTLRNALASKGLNSYAKEVQDIIAMVRGGEEQAPDGPGLQDITGTLFFHNERVGVDLKVDGEGIVVARWPYSHWVSNGFKNLLQYLIKNSKGSGTLKDLDPRASAALANAFKKINLDGLAASYPDGESLAASNVRLVDESQNGEFYIQGSGEIIWQHNRR